MSTEVKYPGCGHFFPLEEAIGKEYEQQLRTKMVSWQKKKEEEFKQKEEEFNTRQKQQASQFEKQLAQEKTQILKQVEENLRKTIGSDFENKLKMLEISNHEQEEKLSLMRQKELDFMKKERELKTKEAERDIEFQRKLNEQTALIAEQVKKQELEKHQLKDTRLQFAHFVN